MKRKLISLAAALAMLAGMSVPMAAMAEDEELAAQVQAASEANADYDVTMRALDLPAESVSAAGDGMFRLHIWQLPESTADEEVYYAFLNKDGDVVLDYAYYTSYVPIMAPSPRYANGIISQGGTYPIMGDMLADGSFRPCEFYDVTGKPLFAHEDYYSAGIFLEDYAWVVPMNDRSVVNIINRQGEIVGTVADEVLPFDLEVDNGFISQFVDGYAAYSGWSEDESGNISAGFIDYTGKKVFGDYNYAERFSEGLAAVGVDGGYGFIDETGTLVIPTEYTDVFPCFSNGVTMVSADGTTWGIIDKTGNAVTDFVFDKGSAFNNEGYAYAGKDGKVGYIDTTGAEVIPFVYDDAFGAENDLFTVGKDTGVIDPARAATICKYGMVDKNNNVVVPLIFDDISFCEEGTALAIKDKTVYLLNITSTESGEDPGEEPSTTETDPQPTLTGDVNGDDIVNAADATNILIAAAEIGSGNAPSLGEAQMKAADVDGNGEVNAADASIILQYAAAVGAGDTGVTLADFVDA